MTAHVLRSLALSPFFWKGTAVIVCAFIVFVGSIYVLLSAVFGLRMGYLVLAVGFFGWMIIMSALWAFGAPGTPRNLGPRGYEPHWQVLAAGTGATVQSRFATTERYPGKPWHDPDAKALPSVDSVKAVMQNYLQALAIRQLEQQGKEVCGPESSPTANCFTIDPTSFDITNMKFAVSNGTSVVGAQGHYSPGGVQVTMFAYRDKGNVPKYSLAFLVASILGFAVHLPFLDRAERKRKEVLTGGTAPAWYGPA